jgi:hypothetical protein
MITCNEFAGTADKSKQPVRNIFIWKAEETFAGWLSGYSKPKHLVCNMFRAAAARGIGIGIPISSNV